MKERYLSKTPNVTFVYLSKCNIKLPGFLGNSKKRLLWIGLVYSIYFSCCLFLSLMIIWVTVCLLRRLRTQNNWIFCKHHLTFKSNCFQKVLISRSVRYKMKKSQELNWYLIINCDWEESVQVLLCDLMSLKLFFWKK